MDKKQFVKDFKKSVDSRNLNTRVSSEEQLYAESNSPKTAVDFLKANSEEQLSTINFEKGTLKLERKDAGMYGYTFSDSDGQVVDEKPVTTLAIVAKDLITKGHVSAEEMMHDMVTEPLEVHEGISLADNESAPQTSSEGPSMVRIKMGDFEFEMRKSLSKFVKDYKTTNKYKNNTLAKALKNSQFARKDIVAHAKDLLENWDKDKEGFLQAIDALNRKD